MEQSSGFLLKEVQGYISKVSFNRGFTVVSKISLMHCSHWLRPMVSSVKQYNGMHAINPGSNTVLLVNTPKVDSQYLSRIFNKIQTL